MRMEMKHGTMPLITIIKILGLTNDSDFSNMVKNRTPDQLNASGLALFFVFHGYFMSKHIKKGNNPNASGDKIINKG